MRILYRYCIDRIFCRKKKVRNRLGRSLPALFLCLFMVASLFATLTVSADGKKMLSDIVEFQDIAVYYADADGRPEGEALAGSVLIERDKELALCYTCTVTEEQSGNILADTRYYLALSPHLELLDSEEIPLVMEKEEEQQEKFGTLYIDDGEAWIMFQASEDEDGTALSGYESPENFSFCLGCRWVGNPPEGEQPIGEDGNFYAVEFENGSQLHLEYAENGPTETDSQNPEDGGTEGKTDIQDDDDVFSQDFSGEDSVVMGSVTKDLFGQTQFLSPAVAAVDDVGDMLFRYVSFMKIELYYAGANGQPEGKPFQDGVLIEADDKLVLRYQYEITEAQCRDIKANTRYYLDVSSHLVLPDLKKGSSLTVGMEDGTEEPFGTIYADGSKAWIVFDAKENSTDTVLSDYGELKNAYFYLNCGRAATPPEQPVEGYSNRYAMKFENEEHQIQFGYKENEPVTSKAKIEKGGRLSDKIITWDIDYTPWQNPSADDGVTMGTSFELRDKIDTSLHCYVDKSARVNGQPVTQYTSRDDISTSTDNYVLIETTADGTWLTFGGPQFNAGKATQGSLPQPLKITYGTSVNAVLFLPGTSGEKEVTNIARLFAGENGIWNDRNITGQKTVSVSQPTWLKKTGTTTRHTDGTGSTTDWSVIFYANGFSFDASNALTLHDQIPEGSTLVKDSVQVEGNPVAAVTDGKNGFTVSPIDMAGASQVAITYQTKAPEAIYDSGDDLGDNVAWFTFSYQGKTYETPTVTTPIDSGNGSGSGTATLVKSNGGYNAKTRTIGWTVQINPHKANLRGGTFIDDFSKVGGVCKYGGHTSGLELVGGEGGVSVLINGKPPTAAEEKLISFAYDKQILEVKVGEIGAKAITLGYTTKVCDPCIFANNTDNVPFENVISTDDMKMGSQDTGRRASAASAADVSATVLSKKAPVYHYETGKMTWTVEVDQAGLPMENVVLEDPLPNGLTYVDGSLSTFPQNANVSASLSGNRLIIDLGTVKEKTVVTFDTWIDPETLGFGGDKAVMVENTVYMNGSADGDTFVEVSHTAEQSFSNHGLVKSSRVDDQKELIQYDVLINPFGLALPGNPAIVDTLDKRLQLDTDTLYFYKAIVSGTLDNAGQKPAFQKDGEGQRLKVTGYDPASNSFTVQLPIQAGSTEAYVLSYTADIIHWQADGYSNNVHFEGGNVLLGGNQDNNSAVGGGGGGGGGGVAARKAGITITKIDEGNRKPLEGVTFTLYQWDSNSATRGLPFAQGMTDAQGKLSFKVNPGSVYELVETKSIPGYGSAMKWGQLPSGVTKTDRGLLVTAGPAKSELKLELLNEADTGDIVFRLLNEAGIPMAGISVQLFQSDPTGVEGMVPDDVVTVPADGTVRFTGVRRGESYFIQYPDKQVMTVIVPADEREELKAILPDGTEVILTADYQVSGNARPEQQWSLTVTKVSEDKTPLPGATVGLYAEEACQTLLGTGVSGPDGVIVFGGLMKSQNYWLREAEAPSGYNVDFKVYGADERQAGVTITNMRKKPSVNSDRHGDSGKAVNNGSSFGVDSGAVRELGQHGDYPDSAAVSASGKVGAVQDEKDGAATGTDDPDIPQTGDDTPKLIAIVLLSGSLSASMAFLRRRKRTGVKRKDALRFFYILCLAVFMFSGVWLAVRSAELRRGNKFYEQTKEAIETGEGLPKREIVGDGPETSELSLQLARFSGEYPETAAWLQIPGTPVDYPVMLGIDNRFYLNHLPDGSRNTLGSLFLDYRAGVDGSHLVIYGHNSLGGKMFGGLKKYESPDYYAEHKTLTVALGDSVYVCPIFSVRRVEADSGTYQIDFKDKAAMMDYAAQAATESIYPIDVNLNDMERIVTLSTCTSSRNQRLIVQAALPGKSENPD